MNNPGYLAANPEAGVLFDENMAGLYAARATAALEIYDFSRFRRLVGVGGGQGMFQSTLLAALPTLRGILFDLPEVVERARQSGLPGRFLGRLELAGGDFFQAVPAGDDYLVSNIIHDWNDERSVAILATCRRAATPDARLLLIEEILRPGVSTPRARLIDLYMLALTGGRERTAEEYGALLAAAGWRLCRVVDTAEGGSILEAVAI